MYFSQTISQLQKKTQSQLRSCVRYGIGTARIADHCNKRIFKASKIKREADFLMFVDTGKQCTISGQGKLFQEFLETGKIGNFSGKSTIPAKFSEEHFDEAPFRIMAFADSFYSDSPSASQQKEQPMGISFRK